MSTRYSVIGLGKLGASMAAAIASRGFRVVGVDVNEQTVDLINAGRSPVCEPDLDQALSANKVRIRATVSHTDAILNSDVSFVIVPTPSDERGAFSLQYAARAFREIGKALAGKNEYHLVVLTSTVLPGSTRHGLLPILERASDKCAGVHFGLCYSPEFIALGSVIRDFLNPDFTLVGEMDEKAGSLLESCYWGIMENNPPCKRMSLENAELTKIALNSFITAKITFANFLADLCERIPGGDVDVVTDALGCDRRIGGRYLKGSLAFGGPCFPRDNAALGFMAGAVGAPPDLVDTTERLNRVQSARLAKWLEGLAPKGATVAVLGLAYKPMTNVIENSPGIQLAKALSHAGVRVIGYDPLAGEAARCELDSRTLVLDDLNHCLGQADLVIITTPDRVFRNLTWNDFRRTPVTVVDFWRLLGRELQGRPGIRYIPYGRSRDEAANARALNSLWGQTDRVTE